MERNSTHICNNTNIRNLISKMGYFTLLKGVKRFEWPIRLSSQAHFAFCDIWESKSTIPIINFIGLILKRIFGIYCLSKDTNFISIGILSDSRFIDRVTNFVNQEMFPCFVIFRIDLFKEI